MAFCAQRIFKSGFHFVFNFNMLESTGFANGLSLRGHKRKSIYTDVLNSPDLKETEISYHLPTLNFSSEMAQLLYYNLNHSHQLLFLRSEQMQKFAPKVR